MAFRFVYDSGFMRAFNTIARKPRHDKASRREALNDAARIAIVVI
jgi:hypothetical protein